MESRLPKSRATNISWENDVKEMLTILVRKRSRHHHGGGDGGGSTDRMAVVVVEEEDRSIPDIQEGRVEGRLQAAEAAEDILRWEVQMGEEEFVEVEVEDDIHAYAEETTVRVQEHTRVRYMMLVPERVGGPQPPQPQQPPQPSQQTKQLPSTVRLRQIQDLSPTNLEEGQTSSFSVPGFLASSTSPDGSKFHASTPNLAAVTVPLDRPQIGAGTRQAMPLRVVETRHQIWAAARPVEAGSALIRAAAASSGRSGCSPTLRRHSTAWGRRGVGRLPFGRRSKEAGEGGAAATGSSMKMGNPNFSIPLDCNSGILIVTFI
ncbi:hypothetical protein Cni_G03170 [Canna indica]|uniref:Uncharacterized protein n=1 Tax=Canna indica TaxID=4628 RepID=A0AAQ3JS02_9LILI|nr:hypothetical protein Cni_G03170 [Canna indica]